MGEFLIILGLGGRVGNDHHSLRAAAFPSPQAYRQETFTVKAARKRPLRRREPHAHYERKTNMKTVFFTLNTHQMQTQKSPDILGLCLRKSLAGKSHNCLDVIVVESFVFLMFFVHTMGVARIFQRGGHTDSYRGYSSDCHLNIVGCLLTKRLPKGRSRAPQDSPLATPLHTKKQSQSFQPPLV